MRPDELARLVDHTLLKPQATAEEIARVCAEAREWGCAAVCVNSARVIEVVRLLRGSVVNACAVVGFPLGAASTTAKVAETGYCAAAGASEIDMVANLGWWRDGDREAVAADVAAVKAACGPGVLLKVILETALLDPAEIGALSALAASAGANFVKTSTGFHSAGGATVDAVRVMRAAVGPGVGVKASGGIRTLAQAQAMLDAGATRLGLSATNDILGELRASDSPH